VTEPVRTASFSGLSALIFDLEQAARRGEMVEKQLRRRGISDPRVLAAMSTVPRHAFVPEKFLSESYGDQPLPIGDGQTISQPFIVASMTEKLELSGTERVLEIGGGSGYQTALLSLLAHEVHSVERRPALAEAARERLARLGYRNVHVHVGDGTLGWPAAAPFDALLVAAAAPLIPPPLIEQLGESGRLVLPCGSVETQELVRLRRRGGAISREQFYPCRFVPLVGRYGWLGKEPSA
jgi:protein-L-isoaspartate(D-aspartate) O-methyltransferase